MHKRYLMLGLVGASLLLLACGEGPDEVGPPSDRTNYPAGPYGTREGAIVDNLRFKTIEGEEFNLDDHVFKDPHNRVLLLSSVAGWCAPCIEEQGQLKAWHNEFAKRGLIIVEGLFEDKNYQPAKLSDVEAWQKRHNLPFPITLDEDFRLKPFFQSDSPSPPLSVLVRVDDMKILKVVTGTGNERLIEGVIQANLPR